MSQLKITIDVRQVKTAEKTIDKSFDKIEKATNSLEKSLKDLENTFSSSMKKNTKETKKFSDTTQRELKKTSNAFNGFLKTVKAAAVGYATVLATMELTQFVSDTIDAGIALDSLNRSFEAITGSTEGAAEELKFIDDISRDLGLNLITLEKSYKDILAASKNTKLEGQGVKDVFLAISKASAVLGMSADDTQGSLRALSQMISKGNVQAEELRGQLGERLPGAFQMAAEAMGVTTMELNDMLENGEVLAEDLLPRLAEVLENRFGKAAETAGERAQGSIEKMKAAVLRLQRAVGEEGLTEDLADLAKFTTEWVESNQKLLSQDLAGVFKVITTAGKAAVITIGGLADKFGQFQRVVEFFADRTAEAIYGPDTELGILEDQLDKLQKKLKKAAGSPFKSDQKEFSNILESIKAQEKRIQLLKDEKIAREQLAKAMELAVEDTFDIDLGDPFAGLDTKDIPNIFDDFEFFPTLDEIDLDDTFFKNAEKEDEKLIKNAEKAAKSVDKLYGTIITQGEKAFKVTEKNRIATEKQMQSIESALDRFFGPIEELEDDPDLLKGAFDDYIDGINESIELTNILERTTIASFQAMEDSLTSFILTGEFGFKELAQTAIAELTRIFVRSQIIAPLANAASGLNFGSIASGLSGMFGAANGAVVSGMSSASNSIISSPTVFPNAQPVGFANGGVMVGEGSRQEAVLPLENTGRGLGVNASGMSPEINVVVKNNNSNQSEVTVAEPTQDEQGRLVVGIVIDALATNKGGAADQVRRIANQPL